MFQGGPAAFVQGFPPRDDEEDSGRDFAVTALEHVPQPGVQVGAGVFVRVEEEDEGGVLEDVTQVLEEEGGEDLEGVEHEADFVLAGELAGDVSGPFPHLFGDRVLVQEFHQEPSHGDLFGQTHAGPGQDLSQEDGESRGGFGVVFQFFALLAVEAIGVVEGFEGVPLGGQLGGERAHHRGDVRFPLVGPCCEVTGFGGQAPQSL